MKRWFYTCLIWLVIHLKIYLLWSRFQQFVFQRKRLAIPEVTAVKDIMHVIREAKWTQDKWWQLWDAFSHPEHAYYNFVNHGTLGDCDDFSAYSCHCLEQLGYDTRILSVQWLDANNKFHGHNVALGTGDSGTTWMISNGFYNPVPVTGEDEAAYYWSNRSGGTLLAWCTITPDLKKILKRHIGR